MMFFTSGHGSSARRWRASGAPRSTSIPPPSPLRAFRAASRTRVADLGSERGVARCLWLVPHVRKKTQRDAHVGASHDHLADQPELLQRLRLNRVLHRRRGRPSLLLGIEHARVLRRDVQRRQRRGGSQIGLRSADVVSPYASPVVPIVPPREARRFDIVLWGATGIHRQARRGVPGEASRHRNRALLGARRPQPGEARGGAQRPFRRRAACERAPYSSSGTEKTARRSTSSPVRLAWSSRRSALTRCTGAHLVGACVDAGHRLRGPGGRGRPSSAR